MEGGTRESDAVLDEALSAEGLRGVPFRLPPHRIDNGAFNCRIGWSGYSEPRIVFRNVLQRPRHKPTGESVSIVGDLDPALMKYFDFTRSSLRSAFDSNVVYQFETMECGEIGRRSDDGCLVGGTLSLVAMENNGSSIGKFSIGSNQVSPSLGIIDWTKKRKLEDEQLTPPFSKLKCITQSSDIYWEAALSFEQEVIESTSCCSQNSLSGSEDYVSKSTVTDVGSSVNSGGGYTEPSELVTGTTESGSSAGCNNSSSDFRIRMSVGSQDKVSAFSEDSVSSTLRNNLHSLACRTIKRKSEDSEKAETLQCARKKLNSSTKRMNCTGVLNREVDTECLKECLDYEMEFLYSEYGQLLDLGMSYADLIRLQACQDKDNDTSLYFSDEHFPIIIPLLSSGGWKDEGTVKCERKPTIDQEFEQYFSSLVL